MSSLQSIQSSLCGLHRSRDLGGRGSNGQIVSIKRADDGRRQRSGEINNEKREKFRVKNGFLQNTSTDSKGATFLILKNRASAPIRKEGLSSTRKARREASEIELVEAGRDARPNQMLSRNQ